MRVLYSIRRFTERRGVVVCYGKDFWVLVFFLGFGLVCRLEYLFEFFVGGRDGVSSI